MSSNSRCVSGADFVCGVNTKSGSFNTAIEFFPSVVDVIRESVLL